MKSKYRLYCTTEGTWVKTTWLSDAPTECPNSAGHVIDHDSIVITENIASRDILLSIGGNSGEYYYECDSGYWEVIRKFQFRGTESLGEVINCSVIANCDLTAYPGEYRLYDITNDNFIATWTINSETFDTHVDATPTDLPPEPAMFEIHGKSAGGEGSGQYTKITTFFMEFV
jgi:hypothetical protein